MADGDDFLVLMQDLEKGDVQKICNTKRKRQKPTVLLSAELVANTKATLATNAILSQEVRDSLSKTKEDDLLKSLDWLNTCLVERGLLLSANREKVWSTYHRNLLANISTMATITKSRSAAAILALHLMKELVLANYTEPQCPPTCKPTIGEREEDIIEYISGYLLKKLNHSIVAQVLISEETTGLTSLMNRGGLTQAKQDFASIVRDLEITFRELPEKSVESESFEDAVVANQIPSKFFQLLESCDFTENEKEKFFLDVVHLFFTVRAHQKCRHLVEKCIHATKKSRKSRPLRDSFST